MLNEEFGSRRRKLREVELPFPSQLAEARAFLESLAAKNGLSIVTEGTLAKYRGCVHWHLRKPREPGTLEATWWPGGKRFWFKVAKNREADWLETLFETS